MDLTRRRRAAPTLGLDAARALDPARFRSRRHPAGGAASGQPRGGGRGVARAARERSPVVPWGGGACPGSDAALSAIRLALELERARPGRRVQPRGSHRDRRVRRDHRRAGAPLVAPARSCPSRPLPRRARPSAASSPPTRRAPAAALGSPRDRVLGARFVLSDGTLARTGGKVVKNVAGYGIHRLLCVSRGGLALIVEASLKLAPRRRARGPDLWRFGRELADENAGSGSPGSNPRCSAWWGAFRRRPSRFRNQERPSQSWSASRTTLFGSSSRWPRRSMPWVPPPSARRRRGRRALAGARGSRRAGRGTTQLHHGPEHAGRVGIAARSGLRRAWCSTRRPGGSIYFPRPITPKSCFTSRWAPASP